MALPAPGVDGRRHGAITVDADARDRTTGNRCEGRQVPITLLSRGDGPTALLLAGTTRRDTVGPAVLHRLARELPIEQLYGNLIILPMIRAADLAALPADLVSRIDHALEFEAGEPSLGWSSMVRVATNSDADARVRSEADMFAFGAPDSVRFGIARPDNGLATMLPAGCGHVRIAPDGDGDQATAVRLAEAGCRNVLVQNGMLDDELVLRSTRVLDARADDALVVAPTAGWLEALVAAGGAVHRGIALARMIEFGSPASEPAPILAPLDGVAIAMHHGGPVQAGDCLAIVAHEVVG